MARKPRRLNRDQGTCLPNATQGKRSGGHVAGFWEAALPVTCAVVRIIRLLAEAHAAAAHDGGRDVASAPEWGWILLGLGAWLIGRALASTKYLNGRPPLSLRGSTQGPRCRRLTGSIH